MKMKLLIRPIVVIILSVSLFVFSNKKAPEKMTFKMPAGGDFSLPTTAGPLSTQQLHGSVVFLFFGFTHCPHICPMTLSNLNTMIKDLPLPIKNKVKVLFISIDPERDTLEVLKNRISSLENGNFIAGTDTEEHLKKILPLFGARYSIIKQPNQEPFVDHTTQVFVINSRGEWVDTLDFNVPPQEYRHAFETADDKKPISSRTLPLNNLTVLGRNDDCDLAKAKSCVITDKETTYEVSLSPHPIKLGETVKVTVKSQSSWVPLALDLQGVERDMGYIRPTLSRKSDGEFTSEFDLPVCDLATMQWRIHLIVQRGQEMGVFGYKMRTTSNP